MKWMTRLIAAGLMLWLAAALLGPGLIGLVLERQAGVAIADLDRQLGQYDIDASALQRGWFSSRLTISVASSGGRALFRYPVTLRHGFLTLRPSWLQGRGDLVGAAGRGPEQRLGDLEWRVGLLGQLHASLTLMPASGYQGNLQLQFRLQTSDGALTSSGISGPGFEQVRGRLTLDTRRADAALTLEANEFSGPGWSIDSVRLSGQGRSAGELLDLDFSLQAGAYSQYGLAPFGACRWELELSRLSLPLLVKSLELRDSQSALALLPPLLALQPRIEGFAMDLQHPQLGAALVQGTAILTEPPPAGFVLNPQLLMPVLAVEAEATIAERLAVAMTAADYLREGYREDEATRLAASLWELLVKDGWLKRQGAALETRLKLENGELRANEVVKQRWPG